MNVFTRLLIFSVILLPWVAVAQESPKFSVTEGDFVAHDFKFRSGEQMAQLRLHYRTLGKPLRDAAGT